MMIDITHRFIWKSMSIQKRNQKSSIKRKLVIPDSNNNYYSIIISKKLLIKYFIYHIT